MIPYIDARTSRDNSIRVCGDIRLPSDFTEQSVEQLYDRIALQYDKIVDLRFNEQLIAHLLECVGAEGGGRILDYGCGTGLSLSVSKAYPKAHLLGVDISRNMVAISRDRGLDVHRMRPSWLKRHHSYFDGIFAATVAHYFRSADPFRQWFSLLKLGGSVAFNVRLPTLRPPSKKLREAYKEALADSGFDEINDEIIYIRTHRSYTVWIVSARKIRRNSRLAN